MIAAGYRSDNAVWVYFGLRALSVLVLLALVFRSSITSNPILGIVIPVAAGFAGWFGPSFVLDYLVSARQQRIREGLPDALDLIVVCVEAGLALDQAMQHVSRELMDVHPDISRGDRNGQSGDPRRESGAPKRCARSPTAPANRN